ncbi:hypothetical protein ACSBR1_001491 [Camellia fascicularis]
MEIKVEVIARETIKPSSPTPHHLKTFKLSLIDQFMAASYTPLVLCCTTHGGCSYKERSQLLKNSLSQILARYYPLAGRMKDPLFVDWNDDGVDYIETRVNCPISSIPKQPKSELQNHFIPIQFKESGSVSLLLIQASFFEFAIKCQDGLIIGSLVGLEVISCWEYCEIWTHYVRESGRSGSPGLEEYGEGGRIGKFVNGGNWTVDSSFNVINSVVVPINKERTLILPTRGHELVDKREFESFKVMGGRRRWLDGFSSDYLNVYLHHRRCLRLSPSSSLLSSIVLTWFVAIPMYYNE